jgi:thiopeptide-type bacteriocin biosynthesis protein
VVRRALTLAHTPIPHNRLVAELAEAPGATIEKVEALVDELWRQTFLLTDLRPPLTDPSPAGYVIRRLHDIPAAAEALRQLESALAAMAEWDTLPMKEAAAGYRRLAGSADGDEASRPEAPPQVDMAIPLEGCHINEAVAREATRAAELLLRMTPLPGGLPHLNAYRRVFEARYGPEREVPLLELLDPNFGLGPPSTHLHGVELGVDAQKAALHQQTLYELAVTAMWEHRLILDLDRETLSRLESWSPSIATAPSSIDLCLFVVAASAEDVDEGRFQIVVGPNLGAAAAGRNLGRFADLLGDEAKKALEEVDRAEFAHCPDCLRAELVYLPHLFRSSNVAVRPHPHLYEICLGTTPGVPPEQVVPLDELVVGSREGRFYVRWPAKEVQVLACAGHMLNNLLAPDVCRFLEDVRRDGLAQLSSFDWGPAAALPVLPRVQVGRVVLSLAQWRIDARTGRELVRDAPSTFMSALQEWRERWEVPRYVYLSSNDNRLILDLDNEAQAEELRREVHKLKEDSQLLLQEPLPAPDQVWVAGPGGHFVTELVVPLVLHAGNAPTSRSARRSPAVECSGSDRLRPPGSDWLFGKLYCPRTFEDDLLRGPVAEFCHQALASSAADDWFFIRYSDPDPHLRLRFRGRPERLTSLLLPQLCSWAAGLIREGFSERFCIDTYQREVERYGGLAGARAAEALFGADSRAVLKMLSLAREGLPTIDMTSLAVVSIDELLAGLGLNEEERLAWYRKRVPSRSAAGEEYRDRKATLRRLLGDPAYLRQQPGGDALALILAARSAELAPVRSRLDALAESGELLQPKESLLRSYVHLHCNRLLAGDWSAEERVLALLERTRYGLDQAPLSR